jgi:GT2 family glycosyltransferase
MADPTHGGAIGRVPKVAIIVVTHREPFEAVRCVHSLKALDYPNYHIIVIHNETTPGEALQWADQVPAAQWVPSTKNLGYTGGNNLGITMAVRADCEYILVLNDDTECRNHGFLSAMVGVMESQPEAGLIGPRVYLRGNVQNTVLRYPSFLRNVIDWVRYRIFPSHYERSGEKIIEAEMLNGVCILLRRRAIETVGMFDDRMFIYVEDADLGFRMRRAGWKVLYVPIDSIDHLQKETGYDLFGWASLLIRRNAVYFLKKHGFQIQAWSLALANLCLTAARIAGSRSRSEFRRRLGFLQELTQQLAAVLLRDSLVTPIWPASLVGNRAGEPVREKAAGAGSAAEGGC